MAAAACPSILAMRVGALQSPSNKLLPFADYRRGNVKRAKKVEGLSCDVDWSGDEESNSDPLRFQTDSQAKASAPVSTLTPSATPSTSVSDTELEMRRVNTLGDIFQDSARLEFCRQVSMCSDTGSVRPLNEGQTGEVFAVVDEGGEKVAVFKPAGREHFHRRDLFPGQGAIREEAAYIIDRLCGGVAGLPITARTTLEVVPGVAESGALQAFVQGHEGYIEDFAMPSTLEAAAAFVSIEQAEAIAILDMRIFNTDRHGGNLLLTKPAAIGGSHGLVPIDHGCCLPPWWSLSEGNFEAWRGWPQLLIEPSAHARAIVASAVESLPATVDSLKSIGLDGESVATLQICTLFLEVGVLQRGLPLDTLAGLLQRNDESLFEEPSWFEKRVAECAAQAGVHCDFELDLQDPSDELAEAADDHDVSQLLDVLRLCLEEELPPGPRGGPDE